MQYERNRGRDRQDSAEEGTASLRVALQELLDRIRRSEIPLDEARVYLDRIRRKLAGRS